MAVKKLENARAVAAKKGAVMAGHEFNVLTLTLTLTLTLIVRS